MFIFSNFICREVLEIDGWAEANILPLDREAADDEDGDDDMKSVANGFFCPTNLGLWRSRRKQRSVTIPGYNGCPNPSPSLRPRPPPPCDTILEAFLETSVCFISLPPPPSERSLEGRPSFPRLLGLIGSRAWECFSPAPKRPSLEGHAPLKGLLLVSLPLRVPPMHLLCGLRCRVGAQHPSFSADPSVSPRSPASPPQLPHLLRPQSQQRSYIFFCAFVVR